MNTVTTIRRAALALAPKFLAFVGSGLAVTAAVAISSMLGVVLDPVLVTIGGGTLTTLAAFVRRDDVLNLPFTMLAPKVIAFALSGVSATALVALAPYVGLGDTVNATNASALVLVLGAIAGYIVPDVTLDTTPARHAATE